MSLLPKIDIVIPVYYAPELTIRCVASVFRNTNFSRFDIKVILVDDSGSEKNASVLNFFLDKLGLLNKIIFLKHETNKGFVEACYTGIEYRESDYKILQNTDTYVMPGWLDEMVDTAESDDSIAMVNPNTNHSACINVKMPPGFNIHLMHAFFRNLRPDKEDFIDLVTSTGFCLLIKSKYIRQFGFFDRIYGRGYCEETDLYFRFVTQGLRGVLARNAYVYHRGEASFSDRDTRYAENSKTLMSRYKGVYEGTYPEFFHKSILNKYREEILSIKKLDLDVLVFSSTSSLAGRKEKYIHNFCNALNESGVSATMACIHMVGQEQIEDRLYAPIGVSTLSDYDICPKILAFSSSPNAVEVARYADYIYNRYGYVPHIVHLVQTVEGWSEKNNMSDFINYSDLATSKITASPFLESMLIRTNHMNSRVQTIFNSVSLDFAVRKSTGDRKFSISAAMFSDQKRGVQVIEQALKCLSSFLDKEIRFISFGDYKIKDIIPNVEFVQKDITNEAAMIKMFHESDVFVDAGYFQDINMFALEAWSAGCKVFCSGNSATTSVLPESPLVSFFEIGNFEALTELLQKEIKGHSPQLSDYENLYKYSSRKIFLQYGEYIQNLIQEPSYDPGEFYQRAYKVLSVANTSGKEVPEKYSRVRYKTIDRVMKVIDSMPWLYKLLSVFYSGAKQTVKSLRRSSSI
jgi:GT2 family glycosyltransferase